MVTPMRKVTLSDGRDLVVRPLKRAEIKSGIDIGLGYMAVNLTGENFDAALDYCLGCQFDAEALDEMGAPDLRKIFKAVIDETWGSGEEEKNSGPSGSGSQTESASTTAGPAGIQNPPAE